MKSSWGLLTALVLVCNLNALPRDSTKTFDLLKKGSALTAQDVEKLETRIQKHPDDEEGRIELLAYYAAPPAGADLSSVKAARARHILWLIEKDPKAGLGLFQVSTGVYRLHCQGDDLADPDAYQRASKLWLEQLVKHRDDPAVRREAVEAIQYCSPEQAESTLTAAHDQAGLGRLYANAVLGLTGRSYQNGDSVASDPAWRERPFALKARRALEEAIDPELLAPAANVLLRQGANLWADGKLDWDYTLIGNTVLAKAKAAEPDSMTLATLPSALPERGVRPPLTIRVGGNVQQAQLVHQVPPHYPPDARSMGIVGTVRMTVLIGLDGKVLQLHADSGPPELMPASMEAVRHWQYKPTLLNGKPCYVITLVDVNYQLSRR